MPGSHMVYVRMSIELSSWINFADDDDDIIYLFRMAQLNSTLKYTLDFFSVKSSYTQSYRHAILKNVK